ncbi:MAG: methyltransferase domain-containing protein [Candidatus Hydrogenedentes bacterium]|nr:methyltransferase domain-containing protein [Candidatus Hydrogenedentota bacterium]
MEKHTKQMEQWSGEFGRLYTDRNPQTFEEMDVFYLREFGVSRSTLNAEFLGDLDRSIRILEVGANVGAQLLGLQAMGFENLYGIELQAYAVEKAKANTRGVNLIQGSAFDIPYKDGYFDLVYTSGVLIHLSPEDIGAALDEIHRCTRAYIWGWEYYAPEYGSVPYRGNEELLWKTDFARLYMSRFPALRLVRERRVKYLANDNLDTMFLLRK